MNTRTEQGYYGSNHTPCDILIYDGLHGLQWYCVGGSSNVNATYDDISLGCDVESLSDVDCFTWSGSIDSEQSLSNAMEA